MRLDRTQKTVGLTAQHLFQQRQPFRRFLAIHLLQIVGQEFLVRALDHRGQDLQFDFVAVGCRRDLDPKSRGALPRSARDDA